MKTNETYKTVQIIEIKFMRHTMKQWEKVTEQRLRQETHITEKQFGFITRRFIMETISCYEN